MKPLVPLIMRMLHLSAIALALNACSNTKPEEIRWQPVAYRSFPKIETNPPQNFSGPHFETAPSQSFDRPTAGSYGPTAYSGVFIKPRELQPAVEFWRKVYVKWRRAEVVFHDDRNMDVIYEVLELPGYVDDSLTSEQKEIVNRRLDFWKAQLAILESKRRYNTSLNANDQQLIAKLERSGRPLNSVLNGASERVHMQRGIRERFKRGLEISERYEQRFRKIFREAGLPEDLAYLPHVESSFQPAARSSAGAVGMWQFTPAAAKRFMPGDYRKRVISAGKKKRVTAAGKRKRYMAAGKRKRFMPVVKIVDRRLDPLASAAAAARYLSYAYSILGDWPAAITSFNHGIGGMKRAQNQAGRDFAHIVQSYSGPAFGFASRNYYAQFLAAREIATNPMQYFSEEEISDENNGRHKINVQRAALSPLSEVASER